MTENSYPEYIDTEGMRRGVPYRAWNEGYNQAIEDALHVMKYSHYDRRSVEVLRKKVDE